MKKYKNKVITEKVRTYTIKHREYSGDTWYEDCEKSVFIVGKRTFNSLRDAKKHIDTVNKGVSKSKLKKRIKYLKSHMKKVLNKYNKLQNQLRSLELDLYYS